MEVIGQQIDLAEYEMIREPLIKINDVSNMAIIGGTVNLTDQKALEKMVFRTTKGHALLNKFAIEIESKNQFRKDNFPKNMVGFIIVFNDIGLWRQKLLNVC